MKKAQLLTSSALRSLYAKVNFDFQTAQARSAQLQVARFSAFT